MYYSSGNYEAFARPRKPEGVDAKRAYFVGAVFVGWGLLVAVSGVWLAPKVAAALGAALALVGLAMLAGG